MSAAWIVYGLLVGTLVALAAAALDRASRLATWPARWVWGAALALTIGLVASAPHSAQPNRPRLTREAPMFGRRTSALGRIRETISLPGQYAMHVATTHMPRSLDRYLLSGWATSSALLLVIFVTAYVRFRRRCREWPVAELHGIRVRITANTGPVVVGLVRPQILVPRWLLCRNAEDQRLVLAHEREHIAAHDPLLLLAGCVAVALVPWHPGVWWMLARLRLAVEMDCDARILRRGITPHSYGMLLIDLAGRSAGLGFAPALVEVPNHLKRRLLAMSSPIEPFAHMRATALAVFAMLVFFAACDSAMPTRDESAYVPSDQEPGAALSSEPHIVIDGAPATPVALRRLAPGEIVSVEAMSGEDAKRYIRDAAGGVLVITTTASAGTFSPTK